MLNDVCAFEIVGLVGIDYLQCSGHVLFSICML